MKCRSLPERRSRTPSTGRGITASPARKLLGDHRGTPSRDHEWSVQTNVLSSDYSPPDLQSTIARSTMSIQAIGVHSATPARKGSDHYVKVRNYLTAMLHPMMPKLLI